VRKLKSVVAGQGSNYQLELIQENGLVEYFTSLNINALDFFGIFA
jgi:hypothetical protein